MVYFKLDPCPPQCDPNESMDRPVCGTCGNGSEMITYPNKCILEHVLCSNRNVPIQWKCNGKCPCPAHRLPTTPKWQPYTTPWTFPGFTTKRPFEPIIHTFRPRWQ